MNRTDLAGATAALVEHQVRHSDDASADRELWCERIDPDGTWSLSCLVCAAIVVTEDCAP